MKLQVTSFYIKVKRLPANYQLKLELQFNKIFSMSNFETASS